MQSKIFLIVISVIALVTACHQRLITAVAEPSAPMEDNPVLPIQISGDQSSAAYQGLRFAREVWDFYADRKFEPFWLENDARSSLADSMIMLVKSSRRFGLHPQYYHFHEIPELVLEPANRVKMARLDIVLTDSFFAMMHDLKVGRSMRNTSGPDNLLIALVTDSLKPRDIRMILKSQQPSHDGYVLLTRALNNILDTINRTDYDLLMYGITTDSIEIHRKVQRIEINLERWRQEKEELGNVYAWINIPAYMFYIVEDHNAAMESRVIVGAPATPTPLFSSNIECFTIFPYWYVPRKITVNEYLPILKRDTSFISRNNFDVLDPNGKVQVLASIDWGKYNSNNFPFTLRQREGTENSLGILKFVFDNPYAVFLHDTNSKRLFKNQKRAYSHGCIRLEKAYEFAHYLIDDNRTKVSSKNLDKYLSEKKRVTINLLRPVPIHVRYFTCDVKKSELLFFEDVYKKDAALIRVLYKQNFNQTNREKI